MRKALSVFLAVLIAGMPAWPLPQQTSSSTQQTQNPQDQYPPDQYPEAPRGTIDDAQENEDVYSSDDQPFPEDSSQQDTLPQDDRNGTNDNATLSRRSGSAARSQSGSSRMLTSGTEIMVALDQKLSTKDTKEGDTFTATVAEAVRGPQGEVLIPVGSKVRGEVTNVEEGKTLPELRGKGRLNLRFRDIQLPNGQTIPLTATLVSVHNAEGKKTGSTSDEGEVQSSRSGKETIRDIGIGAGIGTVAGLIFGSALKGLLIGAIAGGGYVLATKGKDVNLPQDTGLLLKVDRSVNVPTNGGNR